MTKQSSISPHEKGRIPFAPVNPGVRMGHVHLKVADIDRALAFYRDVLGFELTQRLGSQAAFISAGTTIISASTPGKAVAAGPRSPAPQVSTIWRFFIRRVRLWRMRSGG